MWFKRHITGVADFRTRENRQPFWLWVLLVYGGQLIIGWIITIPMLASMMQQIMTQAQNTPGDPDAFKDHPEVFFNMMKPFMQQMMVVGMIMAVITFCLLAAAVVRRLHDRDMAGWWAAPVFLSHLTGPILGAMMMPKMFDAMAKMQPGMQPNAAFASMGNEFVWIQLVQWTGFLLMIVLIVFLALPGTAGPNRYGPDPLNSDPRGL